MSKTTDTRDKAKVTPFDLHDRRLYKQSIKTPRVSAKKQHLMEFIEHYKLISHQGRIYRYADGFYQEWPEAALRKCIASSLDGNDYSQTKIKNICRGLLDLSPGMKTDDYRNLLNLQNGVLNLETYTLTDQTADLHFLYKIPVEYNPESKAERFQEFLQASVPDKTERLALAEFVGYALSGDTNHHKALFLIGRGGNGKGVLTEIIRALIGDEFVGTLDISDFHQDVKRQHLIGKKVNISTEMSSRISARDFRVFKALTSFEPVMAKELYSNSVSITPNCKLIFATNEDPVFPEPGEATYRRFLPVHFPNTFTDGDKAHRRDPELLEKILPELPGILIWALKGLKRLRKRGSFSSSRNTDSKLMRHRRRNNPVEAFMHEYMLDQEGGVLLWTDLLTKFAAYCYEYGLTAPDKSFVGKQLRTRFIVKGSAHRGNKRILDAALK